MAKPLQFWITEKGVRYLARARRAECQELVLYPTAKANACQHQGGNDPACSPDTGIHRGRMGEKRSGVTSVSPEQS